jgi:hypothetical protein
LLSDSPRTGETHRQQRKTTVAVVHFFFMGLTQNILVTKDVDSFFFSASF